MSFYAPPTKAALRRPLEPGVLFVVVVGLVPPGFSSCAGGQGGDARAGERVGPPPSQGDVEDEPGDERDGQPASRWRAW
jgi:hypothetical protein